MKDNYELFAVIREIAAALMTIGEYDFSKRLEESLSLSTVPGEILGETRLRLQEIPKNILIASHVEQKAGSALEYLNKVLG